MVPKKHIWNIYKLLPNLFLLGRRIYVCTTEASWVNAEKILTAFILKSEDGRLHFDVHISKRIICKNEVILRYPAGSPQPNNYQLDFSFKSLTMNWTISQDASNCKQKVHGDIQIQAISAAPNQLEGAALLPWLTRWSRTSGGAARWGRRNSSCPVGETAGTLARELHRVSAGLGAGGGARDRREEETRKRGRCGWKVLCRLWTGRAGRDHGGRLWGCFLQKVAIQYLHLTP